MPAAATKSAPLQPASKRPARVFSLTTSDQILEQVLEEIVDDQQGLEGGFQTTYQPAKHEEG